MNAEERIEHMTNIAVEMCDKKWEYRLKIEDVYGSEHDFTYRAINDWVELCTVFHNLGLTTRIGGRLNPE